MSANTCVGVLGGDLRQYYMTIYLKSKGIDTMSYGVPYIDRNEIVTNDCLSCVIEKCPIIVTPIPFSKDGENLYGITGEQIEIKDFIKEINNKHCIFGGLFSDSVKAKIENAHGQCFDFMSMNRVALENSLATAEGTISEAIAASKVNIHGSKAIVYGYGRCGRVLAQKLKALGASVYVVARSKDALIDAYVNGLYAVKLEQVKDIAGNADFIFNTIPALVVNRNVICALNRDCVIIDIASTPGGTDFDMCKERQIVAKHCLSIPGKYSPKTSGEILGRVIEDFISSSSMYGSENE